MAKKILIAVAAILVIFLGYVGFGMPSNYVITRKITINAPAEKIFPYLNSMKLADKWGPWRAEDPTAQMATSGPEEGVGAKTSWQGGKKLGTGSATIVNSVPNVSVDVKLEYSAPMNMTQDSQYLIEPVPASATPANNVSWTVRGQNNFMSRLMCVFVNMDKMVGSMFEKGLANLKGLAEAPTEAAPAGATAPPTILPPEPVTK